MPLDNPGTMSMPATRSNLRLIVCGGRDYTDRRQVFSTLAMIHAKRTIAAVIGGKARGADTLGEEWAILNGIDFLGFPADWNRLGNRAGPVRNQQMLDEGQPDGVVAFPGGAGTADMIRRAVMAGVPVWCPVAHLAPARGQVISMARITRAAVRLSPKVTFAFGDNMLGAGFGGQAADMRGEPNAVGIPTKWAPHRGDDAFFTDADARNPTVLLAIDTAFGKLERALETGRDVVFPRDGIGTGLAELPERAPEVLRLIERRVALLRADPVREAIQSRV